MARCSSRSMPDTVISSPLGRTRLATNPCQQYPRVLRGLVCSHARQHVSQALVGRTFMFRWFIDIAAQLGEIFAAHAYRRFIPQSVVNRDYAAFESTEVR